MKYILIIIGAIILIGAISLVTNNTDDLPSNTVTETYPEPITQNDLSSTPEFDEEEYVVDPSDIYTVEEIELTDFEPLFTNSEENWLKLMREEEKLARDVYLKLANMWNMRIFSNISSSEQTHTDAIKTLLDKYNLEDPVVDDTIGVFTDPTMQKLYNDLIAQGSESLLSALTVGATIEDLDIDDLDKAMVENTKEDVEIVYQNLQKGSRNHMRAFIRQIEKQGGTYTPQYISESDYQDILSTPQEKGRIE